MLRIMSLATKMNYDRSDISEVRPYKGSTSSLLTIESLIKQAKILQQEDAIAHSAANSLEKIIHKLSINTVADIIQTELSQLKKEVVYLEEEGKQEIANELSLLISSANRLYVRVESPDELCTSGDR